MGNRSNQKQVLLSLLDLFKKETDDRHGLGLAELTQKLEALGFKKVSRRTIYESIHILNENGYTIETRRQSPSNRVLYHYLSAPMELSEWKLLADAIQSSRFITEKKSNQMIEKISSFVSRYEASEMKRQVFVQGRNKYSNETIFYNVDDLHTAIRENLKVSFLYYDFNNKKEKVYHNNGERYTVDPWGLAWQEENYYLISSDPKTQKPRHFRVDKMERIELLSEKRSAVSPFRDMEQGVYTSTTFGMFGGDPVAVTLKVKNDYSGVIIDRFGKDVLFRNQDENHFLATVKVIPSPLFYGWALSFGNAVQIISPDSVVEAWKKQAREAIGD